MVKQNLTKKVWRIENKVVPLHRQSKRDNKIEFWKTKMTNIKGYLQNSSLTYWETKHYIRLNRISIGEDWWKTTVSKQFHTDENLVQ